MKPKYIKQLQQTSKDLTVVPLNPHTMMVQSRSGTFESHQVTVRFTKDGDVRTHCTCDWAAHAGVACSHTMAALEFLASKKGRTLSFWLDETQARRQKHRMFQLTGEKSPRERVWITSRNAS